MREHHADIIGSQRKENSQPHRMILPLLLSTGAGSFIPLGQERLQIIARNAVAPFHFKSWQLYALWRAGIKNNSKEGVRRRIEINYEPVIGSPTSVCVSLQTRR